MTNGWAVKDANGINIRTVGDTRRSAIVNWLFVGPRIPIFNNDSDEQIENLWNKNKRDAEIIKVNVTEIITVTVE